MFIPLLSICLALQNAASLPAGDGSTEIEVGSTKLQVFTYKPAKYSQGPLIVVFHGVLRNADTYRDSARKLGDDMGALIVAPKFDSQRFPSSKYQQGGLLNKGKPAATEEWTWSIIPKLVEKVRALEARPGMPYYLIGHSGGGQFLVRMAGFLKTDARRIVAANPGTHLFPTQDLPYPYGFGKLPMSLSDDEILRRYLAQPLTIYLGTADIIQDENFEKSANANKQGDSRYQRGKKAFQLAEELAKNKGWNFGWRLVEAPEIGHNAKLMFEHAQCKTAIAD